MKLTKPYAVTMENKTGCITLSGYIQQDVTAEVFLGLLNQCLNDGATSIELRLYNCLGGSVFEGNVMSAHIRSCPVPVDAKIAGACASMGTILFASCRNRLVDPMSYGITHRPSGQAEGCYEALEQSSKNLRKIYDEMSKVYALQTGLTPEEAAAKLMPFAKDCYWTAQELRDMGLATGEWNSGIKAALPQDVLKKSDLKAVAAFYNKQLNIQSGNSQMDLQKIALAVGMAGEADENKVLGAVSKLASDNATMKTRIAELEKQENDRATKAATDYVKAKLDARVITAAEEPHFTKMALVDLDSVKAILDARKPIKAAGDRIDNEETDTTYGRKPGETDGVFYMRLWKESPKTLATMQEKNPEMFKLLKEAGARESAKG